MERWEGGRLTPTLPTQPHSPPPPSIFPLLFYLLLLFTPTTLHPSSSSPPSPSPPPCVHSALSRRRHRRCPSLVFPPLHRRGARARPLLPLCLFRCSAASPPSPLLCWSSRPSVTATSPVDDVAHPSSVISAVVGCASSPSLPSLSFPFLPRCVDVDSASSGHPRASGGLGAHSRCSPSPATSTWPWPWKGRQRRCRRCPTRSGPLHSTPCPSLQPLPRMHS